MPDTTPTYSLRFPETGDPTAVPQDIENLALDVEGELVAQDGRLDDLEQDSGWLAAAFTNGWHELADPTYGVDTVYRKFRGVVYLRGLITGGTASTTAFTLPSGYRLADINRRFGVHVSGAAEPTIEVRPDGSVVPLSAGTFLSLDGIAFVAEA